MVKKKVLSVNTEEVGNTFWNKNEYLYIFLIQT